MFGYTSPLICELKVGEHNLYKAIYCGLCKTLKKNYSCLTTTFLSYDLVLFSIFALNFFDDKIEFEKKFCLIHPFRKRICLKQCDSLNVAADLTILLSYFKLIDQAKDEKLVKKIVAKTILIFMKKHFKKASAKQPVFAKIVQNFADEQAKIEKKPAQASIDSACHPTAECLSLIFEQLAPFDSEQTQNLKRFAYFLGRFIYLIDALDDLPSDFNLSSFNPFLLNQNLLFKNKPLRFNELDEATQNELFRQALFAANLTLSQLMSFCSVLNLKKLKPIVDNIVFLGLKVSVKKVFKKHGKLNLLANLQKTDD